MIPLEKCTNGYICKGKYTTIATQFTNVKGEVNIYNIKKEGIGAIVSVEKILGDARGIRKDKRMGFCLEEITKRAKEELGLKGKINVIQDRSGSRYGSVGDALF
jgi:hypothetical protein